MNAVLRRAKPSEPERLRAGPIAVEHATRRVTVGGARVDLAGKEYELLVKLASEPYRVFTKEELLREVWGFARSAGRARWTRTRRACGGSCRRCSRGRSSSTFGAWGTGCWIDSNRRMSTSADLEYALALADEADILTMRHYRSLDLRVETKADLTPVTQADHAVEEALRARIARDRGEAGCGRGVRRRGGGRPLVARPDRRHEAVRARAADLGDADRARARRRDRRRRRVGARARSPLVGGAGRGCLPRRRADPRLGRLAPRGRVRLDDEPARLPRVRRARRPRRRRAHLHGLLAVHARRGGADRGGQRHGA